MKCRNCHGMINDGSKICELCGKKIYKSVSIGKTILVIIISIVVFIVIMSLLINLNSNNQLEMLLDKFIYIIYFIILVVLFYLIMKKIYLYFILYDSLEYNKTIGYIVDYKSVVNIDNIPSFNHYQYYPIVEYLVNDNFYRRIHTAVFFNFSIFFQKKELGYEFEVAYKRKDPTKSIIKDYRTLIFEVVFFVIIFILLIKK